MREPWVTWVGLSASANVPRRWSGGGAGRVCHRMRSRRAAFTAALACRAPSTSTEAMVARAQLRRDILSDAGQAEHADVQGLAGTTSGFEVVPAVVAQAQFDALASDGLLGRLCVPLDLAAD